ncbi:Uma2 family endonuclease [Rubrobacter aplysinae]|uniref:Uma2 family endonuclease n=1 Tax=Rubrobacter aplysinae TaxID=909625 RepID=UPI000AA4C394|nr:Uma2 family endonuclease [Rubrobacter aplysinae]
MDTLGATVRRHRFDTTEYHRMAEAGILSEEARVELVDGEVVEMSPIGSRHQAVVNRLNRLLMSFAVGDYIVSPQGPVRLDEHNEPQPDLALLRFREDFYEREHPGPGDALLLVEVSESSLEYDRSVKLPLYAGAGVPEVWIVDLAANEVESHSAPQHGAYGLTRRYHRGDEIASEGVSGLKLGVGGILGGK